MAKRRKKAKKGKKGGRGKKAGRAKKGAKAGAKADAIKDFAMRAVRRGQGLDEILGRVERVVISAALAVTDFNRTDAAVQLGISRSSLYRRMEALGI